MSRVAIFARGIDGLFIPPVEGIDIFVIVAKGSPEEEWARGLFGAERLIPYSLPADLGPYPSTEDLLVKSDVAEVLRAADVTTLLMSASCSPGTFEWARAHEVLLLQTPYEQQRLYENKLRFHEFLQLHGIPSPSGGIVEAERLNSLKVGPGLVIQTAESMGGEGTWIARNQEDLEYYCDAGLTDDHYLVRKLIHGRPYGVTVFVAPGVIALSAIRLQTYYPNDVGALSFAGVQWVPSRDLSERLQTRLNDTFLKLGDVLYRNEFFGFANIDFMIDSQERIFVLECNPRMSAATPQLLRDPTLIGGVPAGELFLSESLHARDYSKPPVRTGVPSTTYAGATMDFIHPPDSVVFNGKIEQTFPTGLYARSGDKVSLLGPDVRKLSALREFCLFSFAREGQRYQHDDTFASLISNAPLYDPQGKMMAIGRQLLAHFRYTDADR